MEQKTWDSRDLASLPMKGVKPRAPSGLIEGGNVMRLLSRLSLPRQRTPDFTKFPIPFSCVATDIMTGQAVVLDHGFLAEAIRASMAIPTVFSPIVIDGRLLVDGGLSRLLPAEDVKKLGADIVIGVDVGKREYTPEELNSFITISNQTLNLMLDPSLEKQQHLCDILIQPDMGGVSLADFKNAPRIIQRGEDAARAILPKLRALVDSLGAGPAGDRPPAPAPMDSVYLTEVRVEGLADVPRRVVEKEIGIELPDKVAVPKIGEVIDRIHGTRFFERVNSRIDEKNGGDHLVFELHEKKGNELGIGFRYDTRRDASLLVNAGFRNVGLGGASIALDAILRDEFSVEARFVFPLGVARSFGVKLRADASKSFLNLYDEAGQRATYRAKYYFAELSAGTLFSTSLILAAGIRGEYLDQDLDSGPLSASSRGDALFPYFGAITIDTYDRTVYPRRGVFAELSAEAANEALSSDVTFSRIFFDWRSIVPVGSRLALMQSLYFGTTSGSDLPPGYYFFLGGVDEKSTLLGKDGSFYGLDHQERSGRHVQAVALGARWEAAKEVFISLTWNAGNTFDEWNTTVEGSRFINGVGLSLGVDTFLGPVDLTIMTSEVNDFLAYFSAGYRF
jgi:NTE family protein